MRYLICKLLTDCCLVLALLFIAMPARAQTNNTIYGCYDNKSGNLRRVIAPTDCDAKKETVLSWNIQGPKDDPGGRGPQGYSVN